VLRAVILLLLGCLRADCRYGSIENPEFLMFEIITKEFFLIVIFHSVALRISYFECIYKKLR
jgi:hypothetical protein